jgi:hypothetical protein
MAAGKAKRKKPKWPFRHITTMTAHPVGQWCKRIRGQLRYLGPWDDPQGALRRYQDKAEDLHAGRQVEPPTDPDTLEILVNLWLTRQKRRAELPKAMGGISVRTYGDYVRVGSGFKAPTKTEM